MTVLDSGQSFGSNLVSDLGDVISVWAAGDAPVGTAVQIECGDLTVLGEIVNWIEGPLAQVHVEHVVNGAAVGGRGFNRAARHATASGQG
jgi:hypothetical protein